MPGDVEETYLHKCSISNIHQLPGMELAKTIAYEVKLGDLKIKQSVDVKIDGYHSYTLYSGEFRLPLMQDSLDVLVIGDWGKLTEVGV